jgi:histidinol phosphatase-like enzyme
LNSDFARTRGIDTSRASNGTIIRAKSPLRFSFVGGGTDLEHYFTQRPGAPAALRQLRSLGLSIVLVSDQSGIARGFF